MFTKEELQFLRGFVNSSLKSTERRIKNLQQKKILTYKQKDLLEGLKKSREFKQNLIKKLEGVVEK